MELGWGWFPKVWRVKPNPAKFDQQVIVNWLDIEVPGHEEHLTLQDLTMWRNRDVFTFVRGYDWTAKMYD